METPGRLKPAYPSFFIDAKRVCRFWEPPSNRGFLSGLPSEPQERGGGFLWFPFKTRSFWFPLESTKTRGCQLHNRRTTHKCGFLSVSFQPQIASGVVLVVSLQNHKKKTRDQPVVPVYPFLVEGSPTTTDYSNKKSTLIPSSLLEDLVDIEPNLTIQLVTSFKGTTWAVREVQAT